MAQTTQALDPGQPGATDWLAAVQAANANLPERLRTLGARAVYDPEYDLLHVAIGDPQPAITDSVDGNVGVRYDPESHVLYGVEIISVRALAARVPAGGLLLCHLMQATGGRVATDAGALPELPIAGETIAAGLWAALAALNTDA